MSLERFGVDPLASSELIEALTASALVAPLASGNEVLNDVAPTISVADDVVDADVILGGLAGTVTGVFGEGAPAPHALAGFPVAPPLEHLHPTLEAILSVSLVPPVVCGVRRCHVCS